MIYICYSAATGEFNVSTNIKSISQASGIPYHKAYRLLSNGTGTIKHGEYLLGKTDKLLKGSQRVSTKKEPEFDDFFKPIGNDDVSRTPAKEDKRDTGAEEV